MLTDLKKRLEGMNLSAVARESGVAYQTVYHLSKGTHDNPTLKTLQTLTDWLDANDAERAQ